MRSISGIAGRLPALIALLVLLAVGPGLSASSSLAQDASATTEQAAKAAVNPVDDARRQLEQAKQQLDAIEKQLTPAIGDDDKLVDMMDQVEKVSRAVIQISVDLRPSFDQLKSRLEQLGDPPAEGQPAEAQIVTDERNRLKSERAEINALTGQAESLSTEASQLGTAITIARRDMFSKKLLARRDITLDLFATAWTMAGQEGATLERTFGSWTSFIWRFKAVYFGGALMGSLAFAIVLMMTIRRLFGSLVRRDRTQEAPSYLSRLSVAFWSTTISTLSFTTFLTVSYTLFDRFNVLRQDVAPIIAACFGMTGMVFFVWRLSKATLAPGDVQWRLVNVSNGGAKSLVRVFTLMAAVNGFDYVLEAISTTAGSDLILTVVKSLIASVIIGLLLIALSFSRPILNSSGDPKDPGRPLPHFAAILLRICGAAIILLCLAGYVSLARFLSTQLIVTGAVVITVYIGILSGRAVSEQNGFPRTAVGRYIGERFKIEAKTLDQLGLAVGFFIYIFALLAGFPLILLSWGFQFADIERWVYRIFTNITIGSFSISIVGILGGLIIFAIALVVSRLFENWLDRNVLGRTYMDTGVRNSVKTGVGYLGIGIAIMFGLSAAGISLSNLALVAGALSLGIGFGLQNIVSNFVSGLILLAERPFKVGDWVVTGTTEGFVRRISVRATEIETFQRQTIIVPNSEFINSSVGNWTHRNKIGRIEIMVGVSYDSDPRRVLEILKEIADGHPKLLHFPEPMVVFANFGDSSLDFELRAYLADILDGLGVRTEIRLQIYERFKAEGIEIPFPQRDLNINMKSEKIAEAVRAARDVGRWPEEFSGRKRGKRPAADISELENEGHPDIPEGDGNVEDGADGPNQQ
ncbi:mechanosensitive ion channel domain-containing protein [Rhizobium sp. PAMB 3182]